MRSNTRSPIDLAWSRGLVIVNISFVTFKQNKHVFSSNNAETAPDVLIVRLHRFF